MGIFLTLSTSPLLLSLHPVTQSPIPIHQDNYFPFYFGNLWRKSVRRELWRSPDLRCFPEQNIFKVRSDCSGNCSGKFWICKSGDSTVLGQCCSVCYAPEHAVPLCSAGISLAVTCDCCFLGIHFMPLRRVCPWLLSIPLRRGKLLRSTLSLPFLFFWLNKTSSLRFSLQVMGLQLQQPFLSTLSDLLVSLLYWGTQARHNTPAVASKMPCKGNNHLSWPPVYTPDSASSCYYYTSLQGHSKFCSLQSKTEYTGVNGLCR